ncbi:DUF1758 domain-containing protein [Trichonephila inaurata madagascariensis]|uniref:DUF1758 domain-containing protein n=1 Tax=Trichonephila inaurata madagascariensis TaxID=2747483 RepID=A0A8X6WN88_9ARAC|nr:DUF1758 domain-containing protein [Trichonephila inaurata madagascariensis]
MSVESLRVKLRSSFTMCCTSIEEALKEDTSLADLYALKRQIMDKFARLDTVQEHILKLLLGDETLSEKYHDKMNVICGAGDFLNFWSRFKKIHIDSDIGDDDKMHYHSMQCSRFKNVQIEAVLWAWERCRNTDPTSEGQGSGRSLDILMTFLCKEVESEEMILLARTGLGSMQCQRLKATAEESSLATSAALVLSEIKEKGIIVPDLCNSVNEIDMLLGAEVISVILSGRTIKLMSGLIAIGTMLGFTLMGKSSQEVNDDTEVSVLATREIQLNMFLNQLNVKELWGIETIGIRDPVENIKSEIQHSDVIERFQIDIKILSSGRYEVVLPFKIEGQLRDNRGLTLKRLKRTCKKMGEKNSLKEYASIFYEWEALKIIEKS